MMNLTLKAETEIREDGTAPPSAISIDNTSAGAVEVGLVGEWRSRRGEWRRALTAQCSMAQMVNVDRIEHSALTIGHCHRQVPSTQPRVR